MAVHATIPDGRLIASGGVMNGLDAAKALWLGAEMVSMAGVVLRAISDDGIGSPDREGACAHIGQWTEQLRLALFLTGAGSLAGLAKVGGTVDGHPYQAGH